MRWLARAGLMALVAELSMTSVPARAETTTDQTVTAKPADPPPGTELVERRTEATKPFATEEAGTYRTTTFAGPVHYRDASGRWADIDTTLARRFYARSFGRCRLT